MSLILAIEPDRRQAARLSSLARGPLNVELVIGDTTERAFQALGARVPDLVLTSLLLSPKDEAALGERLRELDAAGAHVQTLVIPVLGTGEGEAKRSGGLFGRLRRSSNNEAAPNGCDPSVFGDQIAEYLERAVAERAALAAAQADLDAAWAEEPPPSPQEPEALAMAATPDDEALFGEFAAIPILHAQPASEPESSADALRDDFAEQLRAQLSPVVEPAIAPTADVTAASQVAQPHAAEEDWEEIQLDVTGEAEPHSEITAEAVDLDAFVLELHNEREPATVEASTQVESVMSMVEMGAPLDVSAPFEVSAPLEVSPPFEFSAPLAPRASGLDLDDFAAALEQVITPEETAVQSDPEPEFVAAAALPEPPPAPEPPRAPQTGWQDVLSAIRRDIGHLRGDDEPPAPPRAKSGFSLEPLVFPRSVEQVPAPMEQIEPVEHAEPIEFPVDRVDEPRPLEELLASLEPAEEPGPSVDLESIDVHSIDLTVDTVDLPSVDLSPVDLPSVDVPIEAVPVSEPPPVIEEYHSHPLQIPEPPKSRPSKAKKKRRHEHSKPAVVTVHVDEWGFFDPQKVGFGALLSKLNEITDREQRAALPRH